MSVPAELDENAEDKWREREPNLTGLTSEFDLELFRSSQAEACSKYASVCIINYRHNIFFQLIE